MNRALREDVGIEPDALGPMADLLALGLVNGTWRNTEVENWHSEGRLHDGDMLRVNSHTSMRVRRRVRGWMIELDLDPEGSMSQLDSISVEEIESLAIGLYRWFTNPRRKLPTGVVLADLAGDELDIYRDDADHALGSFVAEAEENGARFAILRAADHGGLACKKWWGHPRWSGIVDTLGTVLRDPTHPHWNFSPMPDVAELEIPDIERLQGVLLSAPWDLSSADARWLVHAAYIGYLPYAEGQ